MAGTGQIVYAPCAGSTDLGDEEGETVGSMTRSVSSMSRLGERPGFCEIGSYVEKMV